jgi:PilZ domain
VQNKGELRRHARTAITSPIQLSWTDRLGEQKFATAKILDVSETGLRVQMREVMVKQTYVSLRADQIALQGSASVRSCTKQGTQYVVGLEFSGGMKWKPKDKK